MEYQIYRTTDLLIDSNSIQLFLSSKTEMQNVIGEARNQTVPNQVEQTTPPQLQQTPPPLQLQPYMASNEYPKPPERPGFPPQDRLERGYTKPNEEFGKASYQQVNMPGGPENDHQIPNQRPFDDHSNRYPDRMGAFQNVSGQPPNLREGQSYLIDCHRLYSKADAHYFYH
jgi:hypothetical protein